MRKIILTAVVCLHGIQLGGCDPRHLFMPPQLSPIEDPTGAKDYQPVTMPMPQKSRDTRTTSASLWPAGAKGFFKDQRASHVGDLITVSIKVDEGAKLSTTTTHSRSSKESIKIPQIAGIDATKIFKGSSPANFLDLTSAPKYTGKGDIKRSESVNLRVAAVVTQVLNNGNLILRGTQEIMINNEIRMLEVSGIIRKEDIKSDNTVTYDRIAEARIAYRGRGDIAKTQRPRLGFHLIDSLSPL